MPWRRAGGKHVSKALVSVKGDGIILGGMSLPHPVAMGNIKISLYIITSWWCCNHLLVFCFLNSWGEMMQFEQSICLKCVVQQPARSLF